MQNKELGFVREMFEKIAPRYDFLNRLLSLRKDIYWRQTLVSVMEIPAKGRVLDVACGTGDIGIEIIKQKGHRVSVFGADFSTNMLRIAKNKADMLFCSSSIHLVAANAFHLPFGPEIFDAATIAFGIRNINDKTAALKNFHNSLKPKGMLLVLELTTPVKGMLLSLYLFYFKRILPLIGRLFSKNSMAYKYLPSSVANFPDAKTFALMMRDAGFKKVMWKKMTMGIATLFIGFKQ
jgi:demethylmenaquinone methyltransferase/2-methoxy-6-polyprenyl-1,4-benzoquinol methylase